MSILFSPEFRLFPGYIHRVWPPASFFSSFYHFALDHVNFIFSVSCLLFTASIMVSYQAIVVSVSLLHFLLSDVSSLLGSFLVSRSFPAPHGILMRMRIKYSDFFFLTWAVINPLPHREAASSKPSGMFIFQAAESFPRSCELCFASFSKRKVHPRCTWGGLKTAGIWSGRKLGVCPCLIIPPATVASSPCPWVRGTP